MSKKAREEAAKTGELPHQWLLAVMRGKRKFTEKLRIGDAEKTIKRTPTLAERIDAAKAAAPFFQPKLANIEFKDTTVKTHEEALDELE